MLGPGFEQMARVEGGNPDQRGIEEIARRLQVPVSPAMSGASVRPNRSVGSGPKWTGRSLWENTLMVSPSG